MIELPICRWRGESPLPNGHFTCVSPKLIVGSAGVSADICKQCPYVNHPEEAGFTSAQKATAFGMASLRHALGGFKSLSDEQYAARLGICDTCESCDKSTETWQCKECGCNLKEGPIMAGKARWESESCPKGLWPKVELPMVPVKRCGGCG